MSEPSVPPGARSRYGLLGVAVVIVAAVLAFGCSSSGSTADPDTYTCTTKPVEVEQPDIQFPGTKSTGVVSVHGSALPPLPDSGKDPAVGCAAPVIDGQRFDGIPTRIGGTGVGRSPTIVIAAAHWCPHCNADLPKLEAAVRGGSAGMRYVVVSTSVDANSANYPPATWLLGKMHWSGGVLADDARSTAAKALGVNAFPMYILIDSQGEVVERFTGETSPDELMKKANHLAAVSIEGGLHRGKGS